jgi:hypothetical protein
MNGIASKLHGILPKYKIKVRSIDLELRQPVQSHCAVDTPVAVLAAHCLAREDA